MEFQQIFLDPLDQSMEIISLVFFQLNKQNIKFYLRKFIKFSIFLLLLDDINRDFSNEWVLLLADLGDILDHLDYLWHNNYPFVDFLLDGGNRYYFLLSGEGMDLGTFKTIHGLHFGLIIRYHILDDLEILLLDDGLGILHLRNHFGYECSSINNFIHVNFLLNWVLLVGMSVDDLIHSFMDNFVFSAHEAIVSGDFYDFVDIDWWDVGDIDGFVLSHLDDHLHWLLDVSVYDDGF